MKSTSTSTSRIGAGEVGEEDQRALEHADEHDAVGVIGRDLRARRSTHSPDRGLVEQRLRTGRSSGRRAAVAHSASVSRTASRSSAVRSRRPRVDELDQLVLQAAAGLGIALADVRHQHLPERAPPPARRRCGTCGGGGPRCPGGRSRRRCGRPRPRRRRTGRRRRPPVTGLTSPKLSSSDSCASIEPGGGGELGAGECSRLGAGRAEQVVVGLAVVDGQGRVRTPGGRAARAARRGGGALRRRGA